MYWSIEMKMILFDGDEVFCDEIIIGKGGFIVDGHRVIPFYCVLKILAA